MKLDPGWYTIGLSTGNSVHLHVKLIKRKKVLFSRRKNVIILPKTKYGEETHTEPSNLRAMTVQPRWQYVLTGDGASAAQIWYTPDFL